MILRFNKHQINIIQAIIIIKCYILYWNVSMNSLISIISINLWSHLNLYITIVLNNQFYPFSWFMVTVVILVSPIVILNSIDYLSIMDSYPFVFYIILFQFSMINFVLFHDIIIASFYWDLSGLISYLLINYWSSKVNCGIKAVLYNKIGDNFNMNGLHYSQYYMIIIILLGFRYSASSTPIISSVGVAIGAGSTPSISIF